MSNITAENIKLLREKTGAGMMDCKKALVENDGDINKATSWLRKKGITKAEKKSSRVAAQGLVGFKTSDNFSLLLEINSETDFVSKNEDFQNLNLIFGDMVSQIKKQKQKNILSGRFEAWQVIARKLAHEIRNPLTPIQLSLDRIKSKIIDDDNSKKHLLIIDNQINAISELVDNFSDFARMPNPVFEKNNLTKIIFDASETYRLNYEKIKFVINNTIKNGDIFCDKNQINRVMINIYKNSVESIEEKNSDGEIITNLSEDRKYFLITIFDNGVGFKDSGNNKQDPYFTTKKNGSGLGLSIVSKIIHEHNGQIFYDNRNDQEGAFVTITLPKLNEKNFNS